MNLLLKVYTCDGWVDVGVEYAIARLQPKEAERLVGLIEFARELKARPGLKSLGSLTFRDGLLWFDWDDELDARLGNKQWVTITDERVDEIADDIDDIEVSVCELEVGTSGVQWTGCAGSTSVEVFTAHVSYNKLVALAEEETNG